ARARRMRESNVGSTFSGLLRRSSEYRVQAHAVIVDQDRGFNAQLCTGEALWGEAASHRIQDDEDEHDQQRDANSSQQQVLQARYLNHRPGPFSVLRTA